MSPAGYARPLSIDLKPSRMLAGAAVCLHGGALLMIPWLPVSGWLVALLMSVVVISSVHMLAGPTLRVRSKAIVAVQWRGDGSWRLRTRDGEEREARLLADSYVHPWLTVLNFRVSGCVYGRRCSLVLLPDSLEPERFRQLRVRLRLEGASAAGSGPK